MPSRPLALLALALPLLAACSGRAPPPGISSAPGGRAIAIVAAADPAAYSFTADSGITTVLPTPSGGLAPDRRPRPQLFAQRLAAAGFHPGRQLTEAVADALRERGYAVHVVDAAAAGTPDDARRTGAGLPPAAAPGAVLRLQLPEIGFHTPAMSLGLLPRLNAVGTVSVAGRAEPLYDATLHFGVDARPGQPWAVPADPRFAYADFDAMLANVDAVQAGFAAGLREVGGRMAQQIDAALH